MFPRIQIIQMISQVFSGKLKAAFLFFPDYSQFIISISAFFFSRTQYELCVVFKEGAGMTETSSPFLSSPAATSARYLK